MFALGTTLSRTFSTGSARKFHAGRSVAMYALKVGDKAPNFTLKDQDGNDFTLETDAQGKQVVMYFYPANNTPGCDIEAATFRSSAAQFDKKDCILIGISKDSVESHKEYQTSKALPQKLLSDPDKSVRKLYEVEGDLFGILDGRQTFVIGSDGLIKLVYNNQFGPEKHAEEALRVLA